MKRSVYMIICALILVLLGLLLLPGWREQAETPPPLPEDNGQQPRQQLLAASETSLVSVYFRSLDGACLIPVRVGVPATKEAAAAALTQLLAGPPVEDLLDSVPGDVKLADLYVRGQTVYVDLSREFLDIPAADLPTALDAICLTVLPASDGYQLRLLVEGKLCTEAGVLDLSQPLPAPALNPSLSPAATEYLQAQGADPTVFDPAAADPAQLGSFVYYHGDSQSSWLIPSTLFYRLGEEEPLRLLAQTLLPPWLTLNDCGCLGQEAWLDLHYAADLANRDSAASEALLVEALVRSACGLPEYASLTILLDGQAAETLQKGTPIPQAMTADAPLNLIDP